MEIRLGNYRVVPHPDGNCWQLERYGETTARGKTYQAHWYKTGHYPGKLHHAVEMLVEYATRGCDIEMDLSGRELATKLLPAVDAMVSEAVSRIHEAAENAV